MLNRAANALEYLIYFKFYCLNVEILVPYLTFKYNYLYHSHFFNLFLTHTHNIPQHKKR